MLVKCRFIGDVSKMSVIGDVSKMSVHRRC